MLAGLVESARELRNPLTVGYSALFTTWLLVGESLEKAARKDALGLRLLKALESTGSASQLALVTFVAAIVGSILWHVGVARLARFLADVFSHPDWTDLIDDARRGVRRYEEYRVVTQKGQSAGKVSSSSDAKHTVPSPHWGNHLQQRVEDRERKAADMSFRVTLAIALCPVALALGFEGGGSWWWSLAAVPVVWLEVALMKHTTLRTVWQYQLEDLQAQLESASRELTELQQPQEFSSLSEAQRADREAERVERATERQAEVQQLTRRIRKLKNHGSSRLAKAFAVLEGRPDN